MKFIDLTGQRFGRLTVKALCRKGKGKRPLWVCQCDCGGVVYLRGCVLKSGNTQSCGCLHRDRMREKLTTHGKTRTPLYVTWYGIKTRVSNPKQRCFKNYGGRGITMHPEWFDDFEAFEKYILENLGEKPKGKTLDRIGNGGNYEPGNVRWATPQEQGRNMRSNVWYKHGGETLLAGELADRLGISRTELYRRVKSGEITSSESNRQNV